MQLITGTNNDCVYASVAMVAGCSLEHIYIIFNDSDTYIGCKPFPEPFNKYEVVPDMSIICDKLWNMFRITLVPFEFNPVCSPHEKCPPINTWKNPEDKFLSQLYYGPGLLEGRVVDGHMCAWDGNVIYDPRGYIYSYNLASKMNFVAYRFWLAVKHG